MKTALLEQPVGRRCDCKLCSHYWWTFLPIGRLPLCCPKCRSWYWQAAPDVVGENELARVKLFLKTKRHPRRK